METTHDKFYSEIEGPAGEYKNGPSFNSIASARQWAKSNLQKQPYRELILFDIVSLQVITTIRP